jgi:hypothetical protein
VRGPRTDPGATRDNSTAIANYLRVKFFARTSLSHDSQFLTCPESTSIIAPDSTALARAGFKLPRQIPCFRFPFPNAFLIKLYLNPHVFDPNWGPPDIHDVNCQPPRRIVSATTSFLILDRHQDMQKAGTNAYFRPTSRYICSCLPYQRSGPHDRRIKSYPTTCVHKSHVATVPATLRSSTKVQHPRWPALATGELGELRKQTFGQQQIGQVRPTACQAAGPLAGH